MPKVHPESEAGYREGYEAAYNFGQRAVAAAKRELAEKVLQRVELFMPPITADYDDDDRSLARTLTAIIAELRRLFTESGVAVEKEG